MSTSYLRGLNMASFFTANKIILFVTFTVYVLVGNTISASRVFVAVSLYGAVRLTVTLFFPSAIEKVSETAVSIQRIKVQPPSLEKIILMKFIENLVSGNAMEIITILKRKTRAYYMKYIVSHNAMCLTSLL